jgi:hypothetical protein
MIQMRYTFGFPTLNSNTSQVLTSKMPLKRKLAKDGKKKATTAKKNQRGHDGEPPDKKMRASEPEGQQAPQVTQLHQEEVKMEEEEVEKVAVRHIYDTKKFEADLKNSYVERYQKWKRKQERKNPRPARPTWKYYTGEKPLTDLSKIPEGWTPNEPDLDKL